MVDKPKRIDAAAILRTLAEIRKSIPKTLQPAGPPPRHDGKIERRRDPGMDFETQAVVDGLESVADELREAISQAELKAFNHALDVYYAAVELTKDGQNPEVLPHVEAMQKAYEQSYGRPIPPPEKREQALKDFRRSKS